jgi:hypothetical protein
MPNDCENLLILEHPDGSKLARSIAALRKDPDVQQALAEGAVPLVFDRGKPYGPRIY